MSESKPGKQKGGGRKSPTAPGPPVAGTGGGGMSGSPMDVELLEQMVRMMSANDLNTVDVRDGDRRVILKRGTPVVHYAPGPMASASGPPQHASPPLAQAVAGTTGTTGAAAAADPADARLVPIKSPMVGTFYAAPKQGEKPFVSVGSTVNEESDVCIIEAMKVFNVIKAETSGTIAKLLIQDGHPVEHGTVLFLVKP